MQMEDASHYNSCSYKPWTCQVKKKKKDQQNKNCCINFDHFYLICFLYGNCPLGPFLSGMFRKPHTQTSETFFNQLFKTSVLSLVDILPLMRLPPPPRPPTLSSNKWTNQQCGFHLWKASFQLIKLVLASVSVLSGWLTRLMDSSIIWQLHVRMIQPPRTRSFNIQSTYGYCEQLWNSNKVTWQCKRTECLQVCSSSYKRCKALGLFDVGQTISRPLQ